MLPVSQKKKRSKPSPVQAEKVVEVLAAKAAWAASLVGPGRDDVAIVDGGRLDVGVGLGAGDAAVEPGDVGAGETLDVAGFNVVPAGLERGVTAIVDQDAEAFVGPFPDAGHAEDAQVLQSRAVGEDMKGHGCEGRTAGVLAAPGIDGEAFDTNVLGAAGAAAGDDHFELLSRNGSALGVNPVFTGMSEPEGGLRRSAQTHQAASIPAHGTEIMLGEGPGAARFVGARVQEEDCVLAVQAKDGVELFGIADDQRVRRRARTGSALGGTVGRQVKLFHGVRRKIYGFGTGCRTICRRSMTAPPGFLRGWTFRECRPGVSSTSPSVRLVKF